ncbi:tautomerase family protein [Tengunoibacter tsumagoiensis]|uniref:Tautomerase n=1 Tax=Tengunoibacter tsumagoiensis TaxID=2014871 RepID=A0A401ZYN1_9CHLR|nr:tautomerase family protein [Tengunoibacter tsumagoiensis]GCE11947.1 tautomerase [Tengunoibacter tsumagoiensis]
MPFVHISLRQGTSIAYRHAIADGVHKALVDAIGIPNADRFQVITEHDLANLIYDEHYLVDNARTEGIVFIQITFVQGRTSEMKQDLYHRIAENLTRNPGLRAEDVFITLVENSPADWSVGNGEAQLLKRLKEETGLRK